MSARLSRLLDKFRAFRYHYFIISQLKLLSDTILEDFPDQSLKEI